MNDAVAAVRIFLVLPLLTSAAACYYYQPLDAPSPQPGTYMQVMLTDSGTSHFWGYLGPDVGNLQGRLISADPQSLALSVHSVEGRDRHAQPRVRRHDARASILERSDRASGGRSCYGVRRRSYRTDEFGRRLRQRWRRGTAPLENSVDSHARTSQVCFQSPLDVLPWLDVEYLRAREVRTADRFSQQRELV